MTPVIPAARLADAANQIEDDDRASSDTSSSGGNGTREQQSETFMPRVVTPLSTRATLGVASAMERAGRLHRMRVEYQRRYLFMILCLSHRSY